MYRREENPRTVRQRQSHKLHQSAQAHMARKEESAMAKLHARPSNQYRYEHYDPFFTDSF